MGASRKYSPVATFAYRIVRCRPLKVVQTTPLSKVSDTTPMGPEAHKVQTFSGPRGGGSAPIQTGGSTHA